MEGGVGEVVCRAESCLASSTATEQQKADLLYRELEPQFTPLTRRGGFEKVDLGKL
jgi:hypothetical protein